VIGVIIIGCEKPETGSCDGLVSEHHINGLKN